MALKLYIVLGDSESLNEEELREAGEVVCFEVGSEVSESVHKVLNEIQTTRMLPQVHIYSANGKIVEMNSGPFLKDIM